MTRTLLVAAMRLGLLVHPGDNTDRGPVLVGGARLYAEL